MACRYGRHTNLPALVVLAATWMLASNAFAGPVTNDTCATAEVVPPSGPFPHLTNLIDNLAMASTSGDPKPSCVDTYSRGVWYTFTPTQTAEYQVGTCNPPTATTIDDTVIAIYTSSNGTCGGALTEITNGCNDDSCGRLASIVATLAAGTKYYIVAYRWSGGVPASNQAALQLEITKAPLNDTCANATPLPFEQAIQGVLTLANNNYEVSTSAPNCYTLPNPPFPVGQQSVPSSATGRDVVYSFTAPADDLYTFRTQYTTNGGNLVMHVATECPTEPGPHTLTSCLGAANRNTTSGAYSGTEEVACVPLTAGQTVSVFVDETELTTLGAQFTIQASSCVREGPGNDGTLSTAPLSCGLIGSIAPQNDKDYYPLGAASPGARVFAMADGIAANTTDFDMRIVTATDTLEYDDGDNSSPWGGASPNIAGCPLTNEPAFLRMSHFSASTAAEPYHLYSVVQPPGMGLGNSSATPETENNGTLATANSASNLFFSGTISAGGPMGDLDLFKFCADKGDLIYLSIDGDPLRDETPIDPAVLLYDAGGKQLIALSDGGSTSLSMPSPGTLTGTTPKSPGEAALYRATYSGVHYAGINTQVADLPQSTGDYLYSIALDCLRGEQLETDLQVTIGDDNDPIGTNSTLTLKVQVDNVGPRTAFEPVLTIPVPANTTLIDVTAAEGWTCTVAAGTIECTTTCFAPTESVAFNVQLHTNTCIGNIAIENLATVTSKTADSNPMNNSIIELTQVSDLGNCDDGEICTTGDTCDGNTCVGGPPLDCDDGNVCTNQVCMTGTGCVYSNNTNSCDDGNACTSADKCVNGACKGGAAIVCNDGDVCTDDICDSVIGCTTVQNTASCSDGNQCTTNDKCAAGVCVGGPPFVCVPQNDCQTNGICNAADGACAYFLKPDGSECNDGNPCTMNDSCNAGACTDSMPVVCNSPPDKCHGNSGTCDPNKGMCTYPLTTSDTDDDGKGDPCDDDIDGDGISNDEETSLGTNPSSNDSDGDGIDDCTEACAENDGSCFDGTTCTVDKAANTDGDDTIDALDSDSDNDGESDKAEAGDENIDSAPIDSDGNGVPDYRQSNGSGGSDYSISGGATCAAHHSSGSNTPGAALGAMGLLLLALRRRK